MGRFTGGGGEVNCYFCLTLRNALPDEGVGPETVPDFLNAGDVKGGNLDVEASFLGAVISLSISFLAASMAAKSCRIASKPMGTCPEGPLAA